MRDSLRLWIRLGWKGMVGWMLACGFIVAAVLAAWKAATPNAAEAARFAQSLQAVAKTFEILLGKAEAIDTAGGFLSWRILGFVPLVLSIFSILLATRMTLWEEQRGSMDLALSTPLSRRSLLAGQGAVLGLASLAVGVGGLLIGCLGARALGVSLGLAASFYTGLSVSLVVLLWACLAGLVAQFARSRGMAAAVTAFLMVASLLVTNLASSSRFFSVLSWISPFTAYQASRPLVRGHSVDPWALLVLLAAAVVLWLLAGLAFTRRDLNVTAGRRRRWAGASRSDASGLLRGPFTRDLWSLRGTAITWAIVLSAYLALFISIETMLRKPLEEFLANAGALAQVLKDTLLGSQPIGAVFFGAYAAPILAVYAVLQVSRWAGELDEGLLVSALSTTVSRTRLMVSRVGASVVSMGAALAVTWVVVLVVAMLRGVSLSGPILARGMAASLVIIVVYLGIGLAVGSWWRLSWAAPVAGAVAAANFVFDIVSQAFHLPSWSTKLSIFARLGNPVLKPLAWNREGVLLLVGLILLGLALLGFQRKDLAE